VATNLCHYVEAEDSFAHEIFLCIDGKASIYWEKGTGRDKRQALPGTGYHLRSAEEMKALLGHFPGAIENTVKIASACQVSFGAAKPHMPRFEIPSAESPIDYLKRISLEKLATKVEGALTQEYLDRVDFEIAVVEKMGFPDYFLIVADFVGYAREVGILVGPGRGSAAGSLVSYALGITNLDPIKYGLLFERFLNPERVNLPDVDIDFQDNRREEVIDYVKRRYGSEKISQIITYSKLKPKAVFKDVARVFDIDFNTANKISALIGMAKTLDEAWQQKPEFKEAVLSSPKFMEVFQHSKKLEGLTRQVGIHAAGVIIADQSVDAYAPLYADMSQNLVCTQYEGGVLEGSCGLVKMDFLGLVTLTIIDHTLKLIKQHRGIEIDIDKIPLEDEKTFELFSAGKTHGIFQFESDGMKKYLVDLKPNSIHDLVAMNAMYRPGPLSWIPVYIARKHSRVPEFRDPADAQNYRLLEELVNRKEVLMKILGPTNLIPIYQEQIMEIGRAYAGYSLGEADLMRRAMGKKKLDILLAEKIKFVELAEKQGHAKVDSEFLFEKIILPFAGYGFNKSHAACYALVAYQTAYLKANFSDCFMAALLNSEIDNTDKIKQYMDETRSLMLKVHPPLINESNLFFEVRSGALQYPLAAVKGVGQAAGASILAEREKSGPYQSFVDFRRRLSDSNVNKQVVEQLTRVGAFDGLGLDAGQIFQIYEEVEKRVGRETQLKAGGQMTIFDGGAAVDSPDDDSELVNKAKEFVTDKNELKTWEKDGLGFNLQHDPVSRFARELSAMTTASLKGTPAADAKDVTFAGVITQIKKIVTKKNDEMAFLSVENPQGKLEVTLFPKTFAKLAALKNRIGADLLASGQALVFKGKLELRDRRLQMLVNHAEEFIPENAPPPEKTRFHIAFAGGVLTASQLSELRDALYSSAGGKCKVFLHFNKEGKKVTVKAGDELSVRPSKILDNELGRLTFIEKYWLTE
jgi:DNA polymerase-3 subunit alpha